MKSGLQWESCLSLFSCELTLFCCFSLPCLKFCKRYAASDLIWIFGATVAVVTLHALLYKSREEHETDTMFEDPV